MGDQAPQLFNPEDLPVIDPLEVEARLKLSKASQDTAADKIFKTLTGIFMGKPGEWSTTHAELRDRCGIPTDSTLRHGLKVLAKKRLIATQSRPRQPGLVIHYLRDAPKDPQTSFLDQAPRPAPLGVVSAGDGLRSAAAQRDCAAGEALRSGAAQRGCAAPAESPEKKCADAVAPEETHVAHDQAGATNPTTPAAARGSLSMESIEGRKNSPHHPPLIHRTMEAPSADPGPQHLRDVLIEAFTRLGGFSPAERQRKRNELRDIVVNAMRRLGDHKFHESLAGRIADAVVDDRLAIDLLYQLLDLVAANCRAGKVDEEPGKYLIGCLRKRGIVGLTKAEAHLARGPPVDSDTA